jgi:nucleotide-binding universal stress UspA family protein
MFKKILHANDGSEHAFHALAFAISLAKQNNSELHMICVEEIDYMPEFVEEVREQAGTAGRRYHPIIQRAKSAQTSQPCRGGSSRPRHHRLCQG